MFDRSRLLPLGLNNHVEMVHRPGERHLARRFFEVLLGAEIADNGRHFLRAGNTFLMSQVTPEQMAFEQELSEAIGAGLRSPAAAAFVDQLARAPQKYFHMGISLETEEEWNAAVTRVDDAGRNDPLLAGRCCVASTFRPGDAVNYGDDVLQAFIHTDVVAAGLLLFGQNIEVQHFFLHDPAKQHLALDVASAG